MHPNSVLPAVFDLYDFCLFSQHTLFNTGQWVLNKTSHRTDLKRKISFHFDIKTSTNQQTLSENASQNTSHSTVLAKPNFKNILDSIKIYSSNI